MKEPVRIALTGFMGVGKSSVARHLSNLTGLPRVDLDTFIERNSGRQIAAILRTDGEEAYRRIESENLHRVLEQNGAAILSLGGGTWTRAENRELIKQYGFTSIWLESTFEHCWTNIRRSRKERPLAKNRSAAKELFDSRQAVYCLADWHYIVRPDQTSYDVAQEIIEEVLV
jgi:shikimate kinase